jgi:gliding motility-associated-like protein
LPTGPVVLRWTVTAGPCVAEDDVVILRRSDADCTPRLNLPNAITPNQDGFNDVYEISGADDFPDLELMVFDRVGHLLFEAKPYRNDWPGTDSSGSPLNPGTYYVRLVSVFGGIQYNTFVDVIR